MSEKKQTLVQEATTWDESIIHPQDSTANNLLIILKTIKTQKDVIGFILRNSISATIDMKDTAKIIDFAILSSTVSEYGQKISHLYNLGNVKSVIIEGKDGKILFSVVGKNKISIFTKNDAETDQIFEKICSLQEK